MQSIDALLHHYNDLSTVSLHALPSMITGFSVCYYETGIACVKLVIGTNPNHNNGLEMPRLAYI